jgi:hypothetical protein
MTMIVSTLAGRTTSSYPLSIGTALAFESLGLGPNAAYDLDRKLPDKVNVDDYDNVWVNLLTLYRNICAAVPSADAMGLRAEDVAEVMAEEVDIIREIVKGRSNKQTPVIFYSCNYAGLAKKYPHAKLRTDTTDRQRHYTQLAQATINAFYKGQTASPSLIHFNQSIKPKEHVNSLILTHYAYDLCSHDDFKRLTLLESHTGLLKDRSLWYTKYYDGKNLVRIPFTLKFLQVFGDTSIFHPHDRKLRATIIELAQERNWNYATTKDRIELGLSTLKNPYFVEVLKHI